jgi:diphosphomevalonate decarboxylase
MKATARAHPNIAFIKYWGNRDDALRLPANSSISMNLDGLYAQTEVEWMGEGGSDSLLLNGSEQTGQALVRVSAHLDVIRQRLGLGLSAHVISENNFPMGAGIASSAAAFAALTVAAVSASGETLSERELTTLARRGSGSASRSVPPGFVVWHAADTHQDSYAESVADPAYWDLMDVIAVVSSSHKRTGSQEGHTTAWTSDLQQARVSSAQQRLDACRQAIVERSFPAFAEVVEHDSNLMHAVMMTSRPPLFYWMPATLTVMEAVREWRAEGLRVCYTLDAGPNVHCICAAVDAPEVAARLRTIEGVSDLLSAAPGGPAVVVNHVS